MEAQTTLVRPYGAVHLDSVTSVDVYFAFVIQPRYAEHDHPFRLHYPVHDLLVQKVRMIHDIRGHTVKHLSNGLVELPLTRILCDQVRHEPVGITFGKLIHRVFVFKSFFLNRHGPVTISLWHRTFQRSSLLPGPVSCLYG